MGNPSVSSINMASRGGTTSTNSPAFPRECLAESHIQAPHHQINFKSPSGQAFDTVVGASLDPKNASRSRDNNLGPNLLKLAVDQGNLISFGSRNSFARMTSGRNGALVGDSSSMIEQILFALNSNPRIANNVNLVGFDQCNCVTSEVFGACISGELTLQVEESGIWKEITIQVQEFSPEYDGLSLSSDVLLAALGQIDGDSPQFYSANGIGRSASLAVLWAFKNACVRAGGYPDDDIEGHLGRFIAQGREQRGRGFVNSDAQVQELLKACKAINNDITADATPIDPGVFSCGASVVSAVDDSVDSLENLSPVHQVQPATQSDLDPVLARLGSELPMFNGRVLAGSESLPYLPISLDGINAIGNDVVRFPFPNLSPQLAKQYAKDLIFAGFYGDALGSDLESHYFIGPNGLQAWDRYSVLRSKLSQVEQATLDSSTTTEAQRESLLIGQLKRKNLRGHMATDDTQQGILAANAKMNWIANEGGNLDDLGQAILEAFREPKYPAMNAVLGEQPRLNFDIRGGAETLRMCQIPSRQDRSWADVAIETLPHDLNTPTSRAGGAGNGSMMRIAYDLLPLLASESSMKDLVEQALISNQVTHPSSFSAVAAVGQVVLVAKCMHLRQQAALRQQPLELPPRFFLDTFHDVACHLESKESRFGLDSTSIPPHGFDSTWRVERLPSQFLKHEFTPLSSFESLVIESGTVEQALDEVENTADSMAQTNGVLSRWGSRSYLGATYPSVVYLLERYGYADPERAVNLTALLTKDSDTCATIVAQVMGALYGTDWLPREIQDRECFNLILGAGFTVPDAVKHVGLMYER